MLTALDEHVAGRERHVRAHGLEAAQVVAVHGSEYLRAPEQIQRPESLTKSRFVRLTP
jgi:hypothetical protein